MDVHPTYAATEKRVRVDELQHFKVHRDARGGQVAKQLQYAFPLTEIAEREFTDDVWVAEHLPVVEQPRQGEIRGAEMIYPD